MGIHDASIAERLEDSDEFISWVDGRSGNVFLLLQDFLGWHQSALVFVAIDWLAYEPKHQYENGKWKTREKLPKWFQAWVEENGTGEFKTYFGNRPEKTATEFVGNGSPELDEAHKRFVEFYNAAAAFVATHP